MLRFSREYQQRQGRRASALASFALAVLLGLAACSGSEGSESSERSEVAADADAASAQAASAVLYGVNPSDPCPSPEEADARQLDVLAASEQTLHASHGDAGMLLCDLDEATRRQLALELEISESVAKKYLRLEDALADGYVHQGLQPVPGEDARGQPHYINWSEMDGTFDPSSPEQLIYDGEGALLTLSYYVVGPPTGLPDGFAGPEDRWHRHGRMCVDLERQRVLGIDGFGVDSPVDAPTCAAQGGSYGVFDGWMLHVWVAPGLPNPTGVFNQWPDQDG